jgi:hypothetical protein
VIGHVAELVEVPQRHAAARLLLVQERLRQERRGEDLVARAVEQVRARRMRRAGRLALAAAQAVLDRGRYLADRALLEDQALVADQREGGRIRIRQVRRQRRLPRQLATVEASVRIDAPLVVRERRQLGVGQELELRDADAMLARDHPVERARERHHARDGGIRLLQHRVIVGVDRNVRVHVAVAGVHVQRNEHTAAQNLPVDDVAAGEQRLEGAAGEDAFERRADVLFPRDDDCAALQVAKRRVQMVVQVPPVRAHPGDDIARVGKRRRQLLVGRPRLAAGRHRCSASGSAKKSSRRSTSFSLLRIDISMFIRSTPSV